MTHKGSPVAQQPSTEEVVVGETATEVTAGETSMEEAATEDYK